MFDNFTSTAGADSAAALARATLESAVTRPRGESTSWNALSFIDFGYLAEMPPPLAAPSHICSVLFRINVCKLDVPGSDKHYIM